MVRFTTIPESFFDVFSNHQELQLGVLAEAFVAERPATDEAQLFERFFAALRPLIEQSALYVSRS
jgi:hypothetical protein